MENRPIFSVCIFGQFFYLKNKIFCFFITRLFFEILSVKIIQTNCKLIIQEKCLLVHKSEINMKLKNNKRMNKYTPK